MAGDQHTRRVFEWLGEVARNATMGPLAYRVAIALSHKFNRDSGDAWPTQETLARELGATDRGVRKSIDQLVDAGLLIRSPGAHKRAPNRYRMADDRNSRSSQSHYDDRNDCSYQSAPDERNARSGQREEQPFLSENGLRGTVEQFERNNSVNLRGTGVPPEPSIETSKELSNRISLKNDLFGVDEKLSKKAAAKADEKLIDEAFAKFWNLYPRKVGQKAARVAYGKVLTSGEATFDELFVGVTRYRGARSGEDPKFTKHGATWLNGACWRDEADAPHQPLQHQHLNGGGRPMTGIASAIAGVMSAPDDEEFP